MPLKMRIFHSMKTGHRYKFYTRIFFLFSLIDSNSIDLNHICMFQLFTGRCWSTTTAIYRLHSSNRHDMWFMSMMMHDFPQHVKYKKVCPLVRYPPVKYLLLPVNSKCVVDSSAGYENTRKVDTRNAPYCQISQCY